MEPILLSPSPKLLKIFANAQPSVIPESMRHAEPYTQNMCKYRVGELTDEVFLEKWINREPFVLTEISDSTTPQDLLDLKNHKLTQCTTTFYDGQVWQNRESTLSTYFKAWEKDQLPKKSLQIWVRPNF
jgi:hypothetical protein